MFLDKEDVTEDREELVIIYTNPMNSNATATNYNKTIASNCKTMYWIMTEVNHGIILQSYQLNEPTEPVSELYLAFC